jgi:alpha-aminoadipate carrier protein LysW
MNWPFWAGFATYLHSPLDLRRGKNLNIRGGIEQRRKRGIMVLCPECETDLDIEEEEVDEGEIVSCPECGTDFEVVTTSPLELKAVEAGYVEEDTEVESEDAEE